MLVSGVINFKRIPKAERICVTRVCHVHHTRHTRIFLFVPSLLSELSATVFQSEINLVTGRSSGEENYHFYLFINLFSCLSVGLSRF